MLNLEHIEIRLASELERRVRLSRIVSSICEQRSHLPGDVEWTSMPDEHCPEGVGLKQPQEESCGVCRRSWASRRMRGVSGLPGEIAEEVGGAKYTYHTQDINEEFFKQEDSFKGSCLPGDETGINETRLGECPEKLGKVAARIAVEILADDKAMYRHDPKHHRRPLGPGWWRTMSGWSKAESDKPGPKIDKANP